MQTLIETLNGYGPLVLEAIKALVVLVLGWMVAGLVASTVRRRVNANEHIDNTLGNFIASVIRWVILLMVLVAVLGLFGIQQPALLPCWARPRWPSAWRCRARCPIWRRASC